MLTIYIALCIIWGVFFTAYMFRNCGKLSPEDRRKDFVVIVLMFFIISTIFAPYSIWKNLPYVISEFQEE